MDREDVKQFLQHREPMLLVDEVVMDGEYAESKYTVTGNEFFLNGHFPGNPIVPGVIICEIMAQGAALLMRDKIEGKLPMYVGLDKVRFKKTVRPGDTICVRSRITACKGPLFTVEAKARVNGEICTSGVLSFLITENNQ